MQNTLSARSTPVLRRLRGCGMSRPGYAEREAMVKGNAIPLESVENVPVRVV